MCMMLRSVPFSRSGLSASMIGASPASSRLMKKKASNRSGAGISHTLIRVTMPRFDCENKPSNDGPTPHRLTAAVRAPGKRPNPVSRHSPFGRTTS